MEIEEYYEIRKYRDSIGKESLELDQIKKQAQEAEEVEVQQSGGQKEPI